MTKTKKPELTLPEVTEILKRHKGSMAAIADELGVRASSVSQTLAGRSASKTIESACRTKALALLEQERAQKGDAA